MKQRVYIETSVISYLAARPSRDIVVAAHQQITLEWWDKALPRLDAFISSVVLDEVSRGDRSAARSRMERISGFGLLDVNDRVVALARHYFSRLSLPNRAAADSLHLALATWHRMDYLITWNMTHIANARVVLKLHEMNTGRGLRTPVICTPEELME